MLPQARDPSSSRGLHFSQEAQAPLRKATLYSPSARLQAQQQLPIQAASQHHNLSPCFLLANVLRLVPHLHRAICQRPWPVHSQSCSRELIYLLGNPLHPVLLWNQG